MTIGFNTLFTQRDVRETKTAEVGTSYWSCSGINFTNVSPETFNADPAINDGTMEAKETITFLAPVVGLPNGATITGVIVYGSESDESYTLLRAKLSDASAGTMASANMNTEDTSISNAVVDNLVYHYWIATSDLDNTDFIYGARITYTI